MCKKITASRRGSYARISRECLANARDKSVFVEGIIDAGPGLGSRLPLRVWKELGGENIGCLGGVGLWRAAVARGATRG